ncbi:uncharacterized protein LOC111709947 isoform X2 [Eurytemora carolleeae]|uniref:uncharacterized protein LOC111709947 isoform X2 n=1 Tax=Eurytemora carolleeae TaxID=1294199 RepID=UPI000C77B365|nr:uncharacterized protein LOC111709947 isoform X2 [Eurytemora carolleeae]|eukprot:XP_023339707.1 uncharacterized protein LOC111709947 isoform X2 [Eurytemora affinis]
MICKVLVGILLLSLLEKTSGREITRTVEIKDSEININDTSETETERNEITETETEPTSEFILFESDLQNNPHEEDDSTNINTTEMNTTSEDQTTEINIAYEEQSSGNNGSETDPFEIFLATFVHELESNASEVIEEENDTSEPVTTLKEALDFFGSLIGAVSEFAGRYENKEDKEDIIPEAINKSRFVSKEQNLEKLEEEAATDLFRIIWRANWSSSTGIERSEGTNNGCIGFGCREERRLKEAKLRLH